MKLYIRRSQEEKKGLLGGSKGTQFKLYSRVELDPGDTELVKRYKLEDYIVARLKIPKANHKPGEDPYWEHEISTKSLMNGRTESVDDVRLLIQLEDDIKGACRGMKELLRVAASFGGEEVFDI
jgi:hypothetical protein